MRRRLVSILGSFTLARIVTPLALAIAPVACTVHMTSADGDGARSNDSEGSKAGGGGIYSTLSGGDDGGCTDPVPVGTLDGRVVITGAASIPSLTVTILGPVVRAVQTSNTGTFSTTGLPDGQYILEVVAASTREERITRVVQVAGGVGHAGDLTFAGLGTVTGKVTLGTPTGNGGILVASTANDFAVTADDGSYTLRTATGATIVHAMRSGYESAAALSVTVTYDASTSAADLVLTKTTAGETMATVRGKAELLGGGNPSAVEVRVAGTALSTMVAADGTFALAGVPIGYRSLIFSTPQFADEKRDIVVLPELPDIGSVELQRGARLDSVVLTNPSFGQAKSGAATWLATGGSGAFLLNATQLRRLPSGLAMLSPTGGRAVYFEPTLDGRLTLKSSGMTGDPTVLDSCPSQGIEGDGFIEATTETSTAYRCRDGHVRAVTNGSPPHDVGDGAYSPIGSVFAPNGVDFFRFIDSRLVRVNATTGTVISLNPTVTWPIIFESDFKRSVAWNPTSRVLHLIQNDGSSYQGLLAAMGPYAAPQRPGKMILVCYPDSRIVLGNGIRRTIPACDGPAWETPGTQYGAFAQHSDDVTFYTTVVNGLSADVRAHVVDTGADFPFAPASARIAAAGLLGGKVYSVIDNVLTIRDIGSTTPLTLATDVNPDAGIWPSPDGQKMLYQVLSDKSVRVVPVAGGPSVEVIPGVEAPTVPSNVWSSSSQEIAYVATRSVSQPTYPGPLVIARPVSGGSETIVARSVAPGAGPGWRFAWASSTELFTFGKGGLYRASVH